jgi:hypothetical protein
VTPAAAWEVYRHLIRELGVVVLEEKQKQKKVQSKGARRRVRLLSLDAQIATCHQILAGLERSGLDPVMVEDERQGQLQQLRRLEEERELLNLNLEDEE